MLTLTPLNVIGHALFVAFGTTRGREGLQRVLDNGFFLPAGLAAVLKAAGDLGEVSEFLQGIPYFWTRRASKIKIAEEGDRLFLYEDKNREGKTAFFHDLYTRPCKAAGQVFGAIASSHAVISLAAQFFFPLVKLGEGDGLRILEHGCKALHHIHYLWGLKGDRSRSLAKGIANLAAEVFLTACYVFKNAPIGCLGGCFQVVALTFETMRKEGKEKQREHLLERVECQEVEDTRSIPEKFLSRLPSLYKTLLDSEEFGRTLVCLNGFADTACYLFNLTKHPIFSFFSLASSGMYGLLLPKYLKYWVELDLSKVKRSTLVSAGCLQMVGITDTVLFLHWTRMVDLSASMGKILILKAVLTGVASFATLWRVGSAFREGGLSAEKREDGILNGIHAAAKVPLVVDAALGHYGHPLPKKIFYLFVSVLGTINIGRHLFWESLNEGRHEGMQKKLAIARGNALSPDFSTDHTVLASRVYT